MIKLIIEQIVIYTMTTKVIVIKIKEKIIQNIKNQSVI